MANYKIENVEGIGQVFGKQLRDVGIKDTDSLLAATGTPGQRKKLAEESGISAKRILKFANMVDLYRVDGIGSEYSELLEASGVDTVPELARRNPANLTKALAMANETKKLTRRVPGEVEVTKWIEQAKKLPRALFY